MLDGVPCVAPTTMRAKVSRTNGRDRPKSPLLGRWRRRQGHEPSNRYEKDTHTRKHRLGGNTPHDEAIQERRADNVVVAELAPKRKSNAQRDARCGTISRVLR